MTRKIVYTALFSALIGIGAFLTIPFYPVSFTLQSFFCILAGACLGGKRGFIACAVYIILGLVGVPIFTKGGGFSYIFQPSFGFLLGLMPASFLAGWCLHKFHILNGWKRYGLFFSCSLLILLCGLFYYMMLMQTSAGGFWMVFKSLFLLFVPAELLKCLVITWLYPHLARVMNIPNERDKG